MGMDIIHTTGTLMHTFVFVFVIMQVKMTPTYQKFIVPPPLEGETATQVWSTLRIREIVGNGLENMHKNM